MNYKLYTDGGSRGNPGPAGIGFILFDSDDNLIWSESKYLGKATNNMAEYKALEEGLNYVFKKVQDVEVLTCYLDSELVVKQLNGEYKVKNQDLKPLFDKISVLIDSKRVKFNHVYRENNKFADKLVNISIDAAHEQTKSHS